MSEFPGVAHFVTGRNKRAIEDHFDSNQELEAVLRAKGKVEQAVGDDPFAVLLADDFLTCDGEVLTADLVKSYGSSGRTQLSVMKVNGPDTSKYGVAQRGQAPCAGGEIQLAEAINTQAAAGQVEAGTLNGQRFDCGSVKEFLEAIMHVAQRDGLV